MYSYSTRYVVIVVLFALTLYLGARAEWLYAGLFAIATLAQVWAQRYEGPIWRVVRLMNQHRFAEAEQLLASVTAPDRLRKGMRVHWHLAHGRLGFLREPGAAEREHFRQALALGVRTSHNRAAAHYFLAAIAVSLKELDEARVELAEAESLPHKPELNALRDELRKELRGADE